MLRDEFESAPLLNAMFRSQTMCAKIDHKQLVITMEVLHNDASAARGSLARFRSASQTVFAAFRVLLVDKVLWLDGHVDDVGGIMVKLRI
jgi:hypothetical protein